MTAGLKDVSCAKPDHPLYCQDEARETKTGNALEATQKSLKYENGNKLSFDACRIAAQLFLRLREIPEKFAEKI